MTLNRTRPIALAALVMLVFSAGCAGTLSGGPEQATTQTPTAIPTVTPTPTASPTASPSPTATPTATPTPVPDHLDYDWFGSEIAQELNDYRGEEWAEGFGDHEEDIVGVTITKPEGWTVQDAEMDGAREVARMSALVAHDTAQETQKKGGFIRPDKFQVVVRDQDGDHLSRAFIDADLATKYAYGEVDLEEYAQHVAESRDIQTAAAEDATVSKRQPKLALRAAEYRPFQQIHLQQIENDTLGDAPPPEIERAEIVPGEQTLYYEYTHRLDWSVMVQAPSVTRTYLETIKKIRDVRRVNRLPKQMVLYQDRSWSREEESVLTTAKTEWAMEYFTLSNWTLPQNKTLTRQELDAYVNRISEHRKFIEDDDDYDPLNETVRISDD